MAEDAIKRAQSNDDYNKAGVEFRRALAVAPWWADGWHNLAALAENREDWGAALHDYTLYLRAAPAAADRAAVQQRMAELRQKVGCEWVPRPWGNR